MKNMQIFSVERKNKILELVNTNKKIVVPELCDYFGVSASTIRKDLRELQEEKLITRTHGGAVSNTKASFEPHPQIKEGKMHEEKKAIARKALEYIEDGDTVAMITSTTVFELVQLLKERKKLTIIVNDILFAYWLEQNTDFTVIMLPGIIRQGYHYVTSPVKCELLSLMNIDKTFISCNGVDKRAGITIPDINNALKIREVIDCSYELYVLCDSSKIGSVSFAKIAELNQATTVITDEKIENDDFNDLTEETAVVVAQLEDDMDEKEEKIL